ncbi:MAG: asparaginase [Clostridia bacterium]|nr:asparaginase [Clostridia bacterium]
MKKILLIATGGTIASGMTENGLSPQIDAEELLSFLPEYAEICDVDCIQPFSVDSTNITPGHWLKIANVIEKKYTAYDGFVVTHGTDTLAYTAAALSCLIENPEKPIVLTGSQRPISDADTDAKKNMLDSLRFAASGHQGVCVVFGGRIIDGLRAKKIRTKSDDAFRSINAPEITAAKKHSKNVKFYYNLCRDVFLIKLTPATDKSVFGFAKRFRGVVVEGYGLGGIPDCYLDKVIELAENGTVVAITTQVMYEGCDLSVYEVGRQIKGKKGIIETFSLTAEAVTAKLMFALGQTDDADRIQQLFIQ